MNTTSYVTHLLCAAMLIERDDSRERELTGGWAISRRMYVCMYVCAEDRLMRSVPSAVIMSWSSTRCSCGVQMRVRQYSTAVRSVDTSSV